MPKPLSGKPRMPNSPQHDETVQRLSDPDFEVTRIPSKDAPLSDRTKWNLSRAMVQYMIENNLNQVQMAERLQEDRSIVNKIVRGKLEGFSIDRLADLIARLYPKAELELKRTGTG